MCLHCGHFRTRVTLFTPPLASTNTMAPFGDRMHSLARRLCPNPRRAGKMRKLLLKGPKSGYGFVREGPFQRKLFQQPAKHVSLGRAGTHAAPQKSTIPQRVHVAIWGILGP